MACGIIIIQMVPGTHSLKHIKNSAIEIAHEISMVAIKMNLKSPFHLVASANGFGSVDSKKARDNFIVSF